MDMEYVRGRRRTIASNALSAQGMEPENNSHKKTEHEDQQETWISKQE